MLEVSNLCRSYGTQVVVDDVRKPGIATSIPRDDTSMQVVRAEPLANGNTVFLSLNPIWDTARAPVGSRSMARTYVKNNWSKV